MAPLRPEFGVGVARAGSRARPRALLHIIARHPHSKVAGFVAALPKARTALPQALVPPAGVQGRPSQQRGSAPPRAM